MTEHAYLDPACTHRDNLPTHDVRPGDKVTLCTAHRVWTVTAAHTDGTVTLSCPTDKQLHTLRAHPGHFDVVERAAVIDGQLSIYDALEAT